MRMFGFDLKGIQDIFVTCPKCGKSAHVLFAPSDKNTPIPLYGVKEAEDLIAKVTSLPRADDLHFLCMNCLVSLRSCEVSKKPCRINEKEMAKELRRLSKRTR